MRFEGRSHARYDKGKPCYAGITEIATICKIYNISIHTVFKILHLDPVRILAVSRMFPPVSHSGTLDAYY
jgi:hypothetical protein